MSSIHEYVIFVLALSISVFGLSGNAMVIWAVRRHKDLRTKHGVLLSFVCIYQSMVLLFEVVDACRSLFHSITTRSDCFYGLLPLTIASNLQLTLLLVISLDLIFLVLQPTKYNKLEAFPYTCIVQIPCFIFAFLFVALGTINMDGTHLSACNVPLSFPLPLGQLWNLSVVGVCIFIMSVYAATTSVMWFRDRQNVRKSEGACIMDPSLRYQRKMMRTLSVFMSVFFLSGFASALITLSTYALPFLDGQTGVYVNSYAAIPNLISCSQNYFVYNAMSKDFHKAFRKNIALLRKWKEAKFTQNQHSLFTVTGRRSSARPIVIEPIKYCAKQKHTIDFVKEDV